jgi:hypothetical protein
MTEFDHFVGTRSVSGPHAFDEAALHQWLNKQLPGYEGPLSVEMFKGGQNPDLSPSYCLQPMPSSANTL